MKRNLSKIKYQKFKEVRDPEDLEPIILSYDDFFSYPVGNIQWFPESCRITIHLSSGERNLLDFMIKTADSDFLVLPNKYWKMTFLAYLKEIGCTNPPKDITIRKGISKIKSLKGLILLPGEKRTYMINPLYFSRSDLNRKEAIRFLLNIGSLRMIPRRTYKKLGFAFDAALTDKKTSSFSLSTFKYNQRKRDIQLKSFEEEFEKIVLEDLAQK